MEACTNPDVLKVIYFFLIIIDIVKIIIPIALIVLGIIDFSKAVVTNDEKVQKKATNLFFKRILYAVLVFIVPWIVEVLTITLGNLIGDTSAVNFTDCIENANSESIKQLENETYNWSCYVCKSDSTKKVYLDREPNVHDFMCNAKWEKTTETKEECNSNFKCYVCKTDDTVKAYTNGMPSPGILCKSWKETDLSKEECN